jgi:hypothetical protein
MISWFVTRSSNTVVKNWNQSPGISPQKSKSGHVSEVEATNGHLMMRLIWGVEDLRAPCPHCKTRRVFEDPPVPKEAASPASPRFPAVGGQGKGATGRRVPRSWGRREDGDEEQPGRIEEEEESTRGAKMGGAAA